MYNNTKNKKMSATTQAVKKIGTSFYRKAGLGYLDMLGTASTALRRVLKEPQRSESLGRSNYKYREFVYSDGKEGPASKYHLFMIL